MTNAITHIEWASRDAAALTDFMNGLFGWQFQHFTEGYYMYSPPAGEGMPVGVMQNEQAEAGGSPNVYISVASIEDCLERGQALGGMVAVPKTPILNMGSFAFLKSPDGNLIGLHESAS